MKLKLTVVQSSTCRWGGGWQVGGRLSFSNALGRGFHNMPGEGVGERGEIIMKLLNFNKKSAMLICNMIFDTIKANNTIFRPNLINIWKEFSLFIILYNYDWNQLRKLKSESSIALQKDWKKYVLYIVFFSIYRKPNLLEFLISQSVNIKLLRPWCGLSLLSIPWIGEGGGDRNTQWQTGKGRLCFVS